MKTKIGSALLVFPARAGMSRFSRRLARSCASVPRASGDEPQRIRLHDIVVMCSPRERG